MGRIDVLGPDPLMQIFLSAFDDVPDPRARIAAFGRAKESSFGFFLKLKGFSDTQGCHPLACHLIPHCSG
jgi:hypothetical protein